MAPSTRYHALDALRAAMMLLGIALHAMASYSATPLGEAWPFKDLHTNAVFSVAIYIIHLFRMPAFFAAAGFFAAMLYARDGAAGLARNRAARVLLPLVIFWALVGPFVLGGFYFAITYSGQMTGAALLDAVPLSRELSNPSPMHLWFLWYLVIYYAVTLAVLRIGRGRSIPAGLAARLTTSWWSLPLWASVTAVTMLPMRQMSIDASPLLFPDWRPVVAYGVFFLFGWLLFRGRDRLERLTMWWSWDVLLASVCVVLAWQFSLMFAGRSIMWLAGRLMAGYIIWALVLATFGAFLHYMRQEDPRVRYLSDASYWMYIVHLPIVIWTAGLLARLELPAGVKVAIVLSVTTGVCLWTYQALVRGTAIGELLNGRKVAAPAGALSPAP